MNKISRQAVEPKKVRNEVLESYPNLNFHSIYNAMMIPSKGVFDVETIASDKPDPDGFLEERFKRKQK